MRLTTAQKEVVKLMEEGWELCISTKHPSSPWLQEAGCGKDGKTKELYAKTLDVLYNKGIITIKNSDDQISSYQLAKKVK